MKHKFIRGVWPRGRRMIRVGLSESMFLKIFSHPLVPSVLGLTEILQSVNSTEIRMQHTDLPLYPRCHRLSNSTKDRVYSSPFFRLITRLYWKFSSFWTLFQIFGHMFQVLDTFFKVFGHIFKSNLRGLESEVFFLRQIWGA